ncbi:hypothetical protein BKI52_21875 [marine bacterium AO1-C]|nr:hypothetical protein BKI52_21875 [marine bacterium AO1-C]
MKYWITFFIGFLVSQATAQAQMIDLTQLSRFTHLTSQEIAAIQQTIPANQVNNPVWILEQLYTKMGLKLAQAVQQGKSVNFVGKESIDVLIQDLQKSGLIGAKCKKWLDVKYQAKAIFNEYSLINQALQCMGHAQGFSEEALKKYIQSLISVKIIDKNASEKLTSLQIKHNFDFFSYLKNAKLLDYRKADVKEIEKNYLDAINKVAALLRGHLGGLKITNIKVKVTTQPLPNAPANATYALIRFKVKDTKYAVACFQGIDSKTYQSTAVIDQHPFVQVFNKVLLDLGKPERLYLVEKQDYAFGAQVSFADRASLFGVILLTDTQYDIFFQPASSRYTTHYMPTTFSHQYMPGFSTRQISNHLQAIRSSGVFDKLSVKQTQAGEQKLQQNLIVEVNDIIRCFEALVFSFDYESAGEGCYKRLTQALTKISFGRFKPTNIVDGWKGEEAPTFTYGFKLRGNSYSSKLTFNNDWIDAKFMDLIQTALTREKIEGNFYRIQQSGQSGVLIFLTPKQYAYLKDQGLIKFENN